MSALAITPSKYALTDLALQTAIELERVKAGLPFERSVFGKLAAALLQTSDPEMGDAPFRFVEPGYYEPFERLYRLRESTQSVVLEELQAFIKRISEKLTSVTQGNGALASELIGFCVALHQELIQEITAEDALVVHEWRTLGDDTAAGICAA